MIPAMRVYVPKMRLASGVTGLLMVMGCDHVGPGEYVFEFEGRGPEYNRVVYERVV